MAKKKKVKKGEKRKTADVKTEVSYKQTTVEIFFTDGEIETVTFYNPADCFRYIERTVAEHYADRVRVELF